MFQAWAEQNCELGKFSVVISRSDGEDAKLHPACGVAFPFDNSFLYNPVKICLRPKSFHCLILSASTFPHWIVQVIFQPKSIVLSQNRFSKKIKKIRFRSNLTEGLYFWIKNPMRAHLVMWNPVMWFTWGKTSIFPSVFLLEFFSLSCEITSLKSPSSGHPMILAIKQNYVM